MTCKNNIMGSKKKSTKGIFYLLVWMMMSYGTFGMKDNTLTNDMIYKTLSEKYANINELLQEVFINNAKDWEFSYYGCCNMCGCRNPMKFTFEHKQAQLLGSDDPFTLPGPYSFFDGVRDTYTYNPKNKDLSFNYNKRSNVLRLTGMEKILIDDLFNNLDETNQFIKCSE